MGKEVKDRGINGSRYIFYVILFFFSMAATGIITGVFNDNENRYKIRLGKVENDSEEEDCRENDGISKAISNTAYISNDERLYESRADVPTVKKLLMSALEPVGNTLYVYGGGWNEDDSGAGTEAVSFGISPRWKEFFDENDKDYDFEDTKYQIHDGLDCTGYVGYVTYQTFGDTFSDKGYVFPSKDMVYKYAEIFGGTVIEKDSVTGYCPGDIMGKDGHVFIVIGECDDGSLLFVHASPPVVSLCGTKTPEGKPDSEAINLAQKYMAEFYPDSYGRYMSCIRDTDFLKDYNQMHWSRGILADPDGYDKMTPEEIMMDLFENKE